MTKIAHYELGERIGVGGMGEVYRATDTRLGRAVAIKILPASLTSDAASRKRLEREAKAAAALKHSNIVKVFELGEEDGRVFIVMELIDGRSLRELMDGRPLPIDRALDIAVQLAEALSEAHDAGVIHRDVKPENVIIDAKGRATLVDFGLAKAKDASLLTAPDTAVGTVRYMSPEQVAGRELDRRTDVWALGVMLYEMIAGEPPFPGEHAQAIMYSLANQQQRPLTERRTNISPELERIVDKMLAKRREERYPGMEDALVDLRHVRSSTGVSALTHSARSSRFKARTLIAAAGGVLAVVAGVWWATHRGLAETEAASIAVLPFANMSESETDEYFSDGLSEELLNALARIEGLHVAARTSSFHFKGQTGDVAEIGKQLNVSSILEGSVRRSGNRVRITAQLINTRDGFHVWSETYDREYADVFTIQEDIAQRVVSELRVRLRPGGLDRLKRKPTGNLQAYDEYLLGRHLMPRRSGQALEQAAQHFKEAIALDPGFTLAYSGLADAYVLLGLYSHLDKAEAITLAEPAIVTALKLDDQLGEVQTSLALLREAQRRLPEAEAAYARAIVLSPSYATAYHWYGTFERDRGNDAHALELLQTAVRLDPMSPVIHAAMGISLVRSAQPAEALAHYQRGVELDPASPLPYEHIAALQFSEYGNLDAAFEWYGKAFERNPAAYRLRLHQGRCLYFAGRMEDAEKEFDLVRQKVPDLSGTYQYMGYLREQQGRFADEFRLIRHAVELEPDYTRYATDCAFILLCMGDEEAAEMWIANVPDQQKLYFKQFLHLYRREIERAESATRVYDGQYGRLREDMSVFDLQAGRYADVRSRYEQAFPALAGDGKPAVTASNVIPAVNLAAALLHLDEEKRAQRLLAQCALWYEKKPARLRNGIPLVRVYALQGRSRDAVDTMRSYFDSGGGLWWWWFETAPGLESIREMPEFTALVQGARADVAREREKLSAAEVAPPPALLAAGTVSTD